MPYIDIENENVWVLYRPLRSMDMAIAVSDGDMWHCSACGNELDVQLDDGLESVSLVCNTHQVAWDTGREDGPSYPLGGLMFRSDMGSGVPITEPVHGRVIVPHSRNKRRSTQWVACTA